jgi:oligopeptide/dipeptide ABC transporter ATP-binding protein
MSGGMRQRVMIAMALACEPSLLIADEPTTALDVTIQAQILELLGKLKEKMGMSIILITHDLGVVAEVASDVVVMYAGRVVESAPVKKLFSHPRHPYTKGLLHTLPSETTKPRTRLPTIEGLVPDPFALPPGCRFADRCPMVIAECEKAEPELVSVDGDETHVSRCIRAKEV